MSLVSVTSSEISTQRSMPTRTNLEASCQHLNPSTHQSSKKQALTQCRQELYNENVFRFIWVRQSTTCHVILLQLTCQLVELIPILNKYHSQKTVLLIIVQNSLVSSPFVSVIQLLVGKTILTVWELIVGHKPVNNEYPPLNTACHFQQRQNECVPVVSNSNILPV